MVSRKRKNQEDAEESGMTAMAPSSMRSSEHDTNTNTLDTSEPEDKHQSKRQRKISAIEGQVGANDKAIGLVQNDVGQGLTWWSADDKKWIPAVYHETIRNRLIAECASSGTYDWPRKKGNHDDDITSFHHDHKTWGSARVNWPKVLFKIEREGSRPDDEVNYWTDNGRVVLDKDNHRVKLFKDLPLTCSSELEGWEIEAIQRLDARISYFDILARMPHERLITDTTYQGQFGANALNMRAGRFRERNGLLCWVTRLGTGTKNDFLKALYPKHCLELNYCEDFSVNLSGKDLKQMKIPNQGNHNHLRGGKAAKPKTANKCNKKKIPTNLSTVDPSVEPFHPMSDIRRKRSYDESMGELSEKSPRKRMRPGQPFAETDVLGPFLAQEHLAMATHDPVASGSKLSEQAPPEYYGRMRSLRHTATAKTSSSTAHFDPSATFKSTSYLHSETSFNSMTGFHSTQGLHPRHGFHPAHGVHPGNSGPQTNGLINTDSFHPMNDFRLTHGLDPTNSLHPTNGFSPTDSFRPMNDFYPINGLHPMSDFSPMNGFIPTDDFQPTTGFEPTNGFEPTDGSYGFGPKSSLTPRRDISAERQIDPRILFNDGRAFDVGTAFGSGTEIDWSTGFHNGTAFDSGTDLNPGTGFVPGTGFDSGAGLNPETDFATGTGYGDIADSGAGAGFDAESGLDVLHDFDEPITDEELAWLLDTTAADTNNTKHGDEDKEIE